MAVELGFSANDVAHDLALIAEQERILVFPQFDAAAAWRLGCRLQGMARLGDLPVVLDIRRFGQPLFYAALAGTTPDNVEWVRRKSNIVARFHRSSYAIGLALKQQNSNLFDKYALAAADFASHGGSFPLAVAGAGVIGSITVSGLPQRADHEMVVEAVCGELNCDYSALALPRYALPQ